ncbi:solute carrier family 35 member F1 isoform X2 [Dendrobium catenatum]|uniref:solute carrier family 35 member F1 isoform X2 n=1 Tax=Dendrobium catenatum TaxID=906689 RepID=UPI0010A01205|nr:solute carrier family 35 member F1 isoform X2 [Dendrobium catenatum]
MASEIPNFFSQHLSRFCIHSRGRVPKLNANPTPYLKNRDAARNSWPQRPYYSQFKRLKVSRIPSLYFSSSNPLCSRPNRQRAKMVALNKFLSKKRLIGLGLGQFVSLLITSTGFASSELSRKGIDAPTSQSFLNYVLLAVVYGGWMIYKKRSLQTKWYFYLLLGFIDVEANFLVVKAYQYTSLTSVMLLDCWTIPSVIFLTWIFLKTKYKIKKFSGVAICIAGLALVVFSDVHASDRTAGSNPVKGDLLVVFGSMLYAVSNVSEEFLVKTGDRTELMAMLGIFGAIISACQISILERNELKSVHWTPGAVFPFLGFSSAMFLFYSAVPVLLKISGSAMLNLSLLTSDMWAVLIRIFAYHEKVDWMYFIAFFAVTIGLIIYSWGSEEEEKTSETANVDHEEAKCRDEESANGDLVPGPSSSGSQGFGDGKVPYYSLIRNEDDSNN